MPPHGPIDYSHHWHSSIVSTQFLFDRALWRPLCPTTIYRLKPIFTLFEVCTSYIDWAILLLPNLFHIGNMYIFSVFWGTINSQNSQKALSLISNVCVLKHCSNCKTIAKYCLKTKNYVTSGKIFSQSFSLELLANSFLREFTKENCFIC